MRNKSIFAMTWNWLRGLDLNQRPSGYEHDKLSIAKSRKLGITRLFSAFATERWRGLCCYSQQQNNYTASKPSTPTMSRSCICYDASRKFNVSATLDGFFQKIKPDLKIMSNGKTTTLHTCDDLNLLEVLCAE